MTKKRRQAAEKAQKALAEKQKPVESETLAAVQEILNPTFKFPVSKGSRYVAPNAVDRNDPNVRRNLDFQKLAELKEVFLTKHRGNFYNFLQNLCVLKAFAYLDVDGDGFITKNDLRKSFTSFGQEYSEEVLDQMLEEVEPSFNHWNSILHQSLFCFC